MFSQICSRISRGNTFKMGDWRNESDLLAEAASGDGGLVNGCRLSKSMCFRESSCGVEYLERHGWNLDRREGDATAT